MPQVDRAVGHRVHRSASPPPPHHNNNQTSLEPSSPTSKPALQNCPSWGLLVRRAKCFMMIKFLINVKRHYFSCLLPHSNPHKKLWLSFTHLEVSCFLFYMSNEPRFLALEYFYSLTHTKKTSGTRIIRFCLLHVHWSSFLAKLKNQVPISPALRWGVFSCVHFYFAYSPEELPGCASFQQILVPGRGCTQCSC